MNCSRSTVLVVLSALHWLSISHHVFAEVLVFRGARVHTVAGPMIENGTLIIDEGRIVEVGPSDKVTVPAEAKVIDVSGKVIIPGLVDSHSHLGVYSRPASESSHSTATAVFKPAVSRRSTNHVCRSSSR